MFLFLIQPSLGWAADTIPPVLTTPLRPVIIPKIAKGYEHSVELLPNGTMWSWGLNESGQLGIGTTTAKTYPAQIGSDSDWAAVSAGGSHTVALKIDGSLWAWGKNEYGQLGDGSTADRLTPVRIGDNTDWAAVSAGLFHTLAIKKNGTLWAWGWNGDGELGDGTDVSRTVPTQIGTDADWASITAGYQYSSAVKTDRSLWEWGSGTSSTVPAQTNEEHAWTFLSSADHHLAVQLDGGLWAWGPNDNGELGDGTTEAKASPVSIGTGASWRSMAAGDSFSLGVQSDGTLWGWGLNGSGQVGDGTTTERHIPVRIGTDSTWSAVGAGWESSLATRNDGTVWAWGITGLGGSYDENASSPVPVPVVGKRTAIIDGVSYTANQVLPLQIEAADNTGVVEMRFKNENADWTTPEPYAAVKRWRLSDGDGLKTVSVQVKDAAGNWSVVYTYSTTLKTNAPLVTIHSPITGSSTNETPVLLYTFSEGTVVVKIDDTVVDTTSGDAIGPLTDGPHTIRVEASDFVGNLGYAEVSINVTNTGVRYSVSAAEYNWMDISLSGTNAGLRCDECSANVPLGFEFSFYGGKVTNAYLQSNGYISFVNGDVHYENVPVPSVAEPNGFIAPFWDDLDLSVDGSVFYTTVGEAPSRIFIAQWQNASRYFDPGTLVTFQVLLHEQNGRIVFQYKTLTGDAEAMGSDATVGIENFAGASGTQYSYLQPSLSSGLRIEFVPVVAAPPALSINPVVSPITQNTAVLSGTTDSGATVTITVDTGANVGPVTFGTPTTWSCTLTNLAEGLNTISITATKDGLSTTAIPVQLVYQPVVYRPTLSIGFSGTGSGTVVINPTATACNSDCTISFDAGSLLTAHAIPAEYSLFSGWLNSACLGTGDCLITLNADTSLTAGFQRDVEHRVIIGTNYYPSVQAAYDAAGTGAVLKLWGVQFDENLLFGRSIGITLLGGFNDSYTLVTGETTINGTVTISNGMVILDRITIK